MFSLDFWKNVAKDWLTVFVAVIITDVANVFNAGSKGAAIAAGVALGRTALVVAFAAIAPRFAALKDRISG